MEYRTLGRTGLTVSRLGFGGIPIQKLDADGARSLIGALCESGVSFIDTARGYTVSEELIGAALDGVRDRFVLATKSMARDRETMARDIEISLKISAPTISTCIRCTTQAPVILPRSRVREVPLRPSLRRARQARSGISGSPYTRPICSERRSIYRGWRP